MFPWKWYMKPSHLISLLRSQWWNTKCVMSRSSLKIDLIPSDCCLNSDSCLGLYEMIKETKHIKSCQLSQASLTNNTLLFKLTFSDFTLHWTQSPTLPEIWILKYQFVSEPSEKLYFFFCSFIICAFCTFHPAASPHNFANPTETPGILPVFHWSFAFALSALEKGIRLWNFFWRAGANIPSHPSAENSSISGFSLPTISVHMVSLASPSIVQQSKFSLIER